MNNIAILLILISALMHASKNFFTKKANDKKVFVWWYTTISILFLTPVFIYHIFHNKLPTGEYYLVAMLAGFAHFLYWYFLAKTYKHGDLSQVYPIMRSSPALILIISIFFLKEKISTLGVTGVILVAIGVYIINMKKISITQLLSPIKAIKNERHTQFAFLTLIAVTFYTLTDKVGVESSTPIIHAFFYTIFAILFYTIYISKTKTKMELIIEWKKNKRDIVLTSILGITGYILILITFTLDKISYIVGLRQISIVLAVLMGGHILKEKYKAIRISASILIFIGAFLITLA